MLCYRYATNKYVQVPAQDFLPFQSMYDHAGIAICSSTRINQAIYIVFKTVTQLMCQASKKMGHLFINGSGQVSFPVEACIFVVNFAQSKNMTMHGPFPKSQNHFQVRRFFISMQ